MQCDVCGQREQQYIAIIEGSTLSVCQYCAKFGKVLRKINLNKEKLSSKNLNSKIEVEIIETIVPDFSTLIKKKRESMKLNHEEFAAKLGIKASILHKIETGHYNPDISTIKKIESILNLRLTEKNEYKEEVKGSKEIKGMTIGDFIKINRK